MKAPDIARGVKRLRSVLQSSSDFPDKMLVAALLTHGNDHTRALHALLDKERFSLALKPESPLPTLLTNGSKRIRTASQSSQELVDVEKKQSQEVVVDLINVEDDCVATDSSPARSDHVETMVQLVDDQAPSLPLSTSSGTLWPRCLGIRTAQIESTVRGNARRDWGLEAGSFLHIKTGAGTSDMIVRVSTVDGREIGRFPLQISRFCAPLLMLNLIELQAKLVFVPTQLAHFTLFEVSLEMFLKSPHSFDCFSRAAKPKQEEKSIKSPSSGNPFWGRSTSAAMSKGNISNASHNGTKARPSAIASMSDDWISECMWIFVQTALNRHSPLGILETDGSIHVDEALDEEDEAQVLDAENPVNDCDGEVVLDSSEDAEPTCEMREAGNRTLDNLLKSEAGPEDVKLNYTSSPGPSSLSLELRSYQRESLGWMKWRESGCPSSSSDGCNESLSDLWERIDCSPGENDTSEATPFQFYLNKYTRCLSLTCPQAHPCLGGILADEMGLGKTICVVARVLDDLEECRSMVPSISNASHRTLIVVPTSLVGQWANEFNKCVQTKGRVSSRATSPLVFKDRGRMPQSAVVIDSDDEDFINEPADETTDPDWEHPSRASSSISAAKGKSHVSVVSYYGPSRHDASSLTALRHADVVLTSYGTLASEWSESKKSSIISPLFSSSWRRIVLDEAHCIRDLATAHSRAAMSLRGQYKWCLTATPILNGLSDLQSLLRFIGLEPWCNPGWWTRVIVKHPKSATRRIRAVLADGPVLLRRTKETIDPTTSLPIVSLPPLQIQIVQVELDPAERIFYDALFSRSRLEFLGILQEGRSNQTLSILALLMKLRQAADHPLLVLNNATAPPAKNKLFPSAEAEIVSEDEKLLKQQTQRRFDELWQNIHEAECLVCLEPLFGQGSSQSTSNDIVLVKSMLPVCTPCGHAMCRTCALTTLKFFTSSTEETCPVCRGVIKASELISLPLPTQIYSNDSSKIRALQKELEVAKQAKDKAIVFSQFTGMLDLIQSSLDRNNVRYERLDGSCSPSMREKALSSFRDDPSVDVMLMSLKAGCLGLNVTQASLVVLMDPWWSFAPESQAIGRAHRIGQTKPVRAVRIIANSTVDEKMLEVQGRKLVVTKQTLSEENELDEANAGVTLEDLKDFFHHGR